MKKVIFGLYKNEKQAQQMIDQLNSANCSIQDVSLLCSSNRASSGKEMTGKNASWTKEGHVKEENLGSQNKSAVTNLSGSLTKLSNVSTINIPELGSFIVAGPLKAILSSASQSNSSNSRQSYIANLLISYGIIENEAKRFEDKVKKGQFIFFYHNDDLNQLNRVKEIFKQTGAEDVLIATGASTENSKKSSEMKKKSKV